MPPPTLKKIHENAEPESVYDGSWGQWQQYPEALWAAGLKITDDDTIIIHMYIVYLEQE